MATSPSRAEIEEAYRRLLELERKVHNMLKNQDPPDLEVFENIFEKQSELMQKIDSAPKTDARLRADENSKTARLFQSFSDLRSKNREILNEVKEEFKKRVESLDQSKKIMRHYLQGDSRPEENVSQRIDENR
jgi:conjugal transfer/entry exclusion protein